MNKLILPFTRNCFNNHMGMWLIEPMFFTKAFQAVKAGLMPKLKSWDESDQDDAIEKKMASVTTFKNESGQDEQRMYQTAGNIAVIGMFGPMMKAESKWGDTCSTIATRQALRQTVRDPEVSASLIIMDSPGGTVAGTEELANDIASVSSKKPVHAHVEDMCASACMWAASQCESVSANATGLIGSLGTLSVVEDTSKKMEMEGTKVYVISTGPIKGAFTDGAPVTDAQLNYLQGIVNDTNDFFMRAVASGRKMDIRSVRNAATGEMYMANKAKEIGLIDHVRSADDTLLSMNKSFGKKSASKAQVTGIDARLRLAKYF